MELYSGSLSAFVEATKTNEISEALSKSFLEWYGWKPPESEVRSWGNSLVRLKDVLEGSLETDTGVLLEYELPLSSLRLDCMVTGRDNLGKNSAEIVELKQWESCSRTEEESLVLTYVGGRNRSVLHPSAQVARYEQFLSDGHTAFYGGDPIRLRSCAFLHNYRPRESDPLLEAKFDELRHHSPLFLAPDFRKLREHLKAKVGSGGGLAILERIHTSKAAPSKQLLRHVSKMLEGNRAFTLLDEQAVVYESVKGTVKRALRDGSKHCVVVRGGPGTGKSVVAINLMADLSRLGVNTRYSTGSKAFTTTLRKIVGLRASGQFDYTSSYAGAGENLIDALITDEAHRIRKVTASRWTPKSARSGTPQVQELLRAGRVTVFFIDDLQAVRPDEIGTSAYIIENARSLGLSVSEFDLTVQFRCQGSDAFVSWIDGMLRLRESGPRFYRPTGSFEFKLFDSPENLETAIRSRLAEGWTARLTAGFCWPWSDPRPDGTLIDDVQIREFRRPWNAKPDVGRLAKGVPRASLWAYSPEGVGQIGCIYTAQGFEFDYVGVIVGPDLVLGKDSGELAGDKKGSEDNAIQRAGDQASLLIRRAYRVLLSRGLKGCYVTSTDERVLQAFKSRLATTGVA